MCNGTNLGLNNIIQIIIKIVIITSNNQNTYIIISIVGNCCNPSLGFMIKARACKVVGQEGSPRIILHAPGSAKECEGMNPHIPK
jgi:hypothetical protein